MKKSIFVSALVFAVMILIQPACIKESPSDLSAESIIPKPVSVTSTGDYFNLTSNTAILVSGDSELSGIGHHLASYIETATGFSPSVSETAGEPGKGSIFLTTADLDPVLGNEGYELVITRRGIKIAGREPEGVFRGIQTLRQLFPVTKPDDTSRPVSIKIATGTVSDYPAYSYRGAMLDVSRHFFGPDVVKKFVDYVAMYRMNSLHLHLSDDQGWRIEIKSWPNLAVHGGSTQVGGGAGGYYTQEEFADIVKYASERYITIVPEIEMPSHSNAALASYPELNCSGKAPELYTGTRVGFSSFCTNKEITYKFVDDVVREVSSLCPGPWFHIGGDESHSTKLSDYIPFINRVQDIVASYGKQMIGWDEIAHSSLRTDAVAQHWANIPNAQKAVEQGARILMSPAVKAYMDMKYDSTIPIGYNWAAYIEVDAAYKWDPENLAPGIEKENIVGIEAALWTETISRLDQIQFMIFPRLPGYAEIGWTPRAARDWDEYKHRLARHGARFEAMGINYYKSPFVPWEE